MATVYLYGGSAKFSGLNAFEWASPAVGSRHRFILFLAQTNDVADSGLALVELEQYGFSEIALGDGRPIVPESLNAPNMDVFRKHYEGALKEGSSIVWYP
ncbi:hypothetical protein LMG19087_02885 [Ralstonia wenshanensis]|uniref:hypothetical protein n=1 Tax=Ralstonia wenshanensis TaxID=2842456 RepID=UPI0028F69577|nr:hypothetical protein [Ralstonia wenshanensis]CAJ0816814.1 hypothetical protein LMG19087_02885 [Ralstonia wenshanensis]